MQRAARLLNDKKISREILSDEEIARAIWPAAVGKRIARHTGRVKLVRTTLVVEVEDAIWQRQLHALTRQILAQLHKATGTAQIQDIEFRIGVPRREPQRAVSRDGEVLPPVNGAEDESDQIHDPVLKKVYRLSRRKATG